jgi:sigma-B regulation protein RsbU (phosphoserine phosphatase)
MMQDHGVESKYCDGEAQPSHEPNDHPEKFSGCLELWAGNEVARRSIQFAGLEATVISLPFGDPEGGDLCALFSCGAGHARVVVADCVGHGFAASTVATHVHGLVHKFRDLQHSSKLLEALNDEFTLQGRHQGGPLRLTTLVTATYDSQSAELNYAYAAHPRMLEWRSKESRWRTIGEGLAGLPIGFIAGENYTEQSVRIDEGDIVLVFSDGVTDVFSPAGEQLGPEGFLALAEQTLSEIPRPPVLDDMLQTLDKIRRFRGSGEFGDDLTLLALRRLQTMNQQP